MQRTNILRDIDEDMAGGRIYLARETLAPLRPAALEPGRREALLRDQIARADALYEIGVWPASRMLRAGRRAIAAAAAMYREILRQIERDGYGARPGRAVVPALAQAARRRARPRVMRVRPGSALLGALVVGAAGLRAALPGRRTPAATRAIVGLMLATSTAEAMAARAVRRAGSGSSAARAAPSASRPRSRASPPAGRSATTATRPGSARASAACRCSPRRRGR